MAEAQWQTRYRVLIATKSGLDMGNGRKGLSRSHIFALGPTNLWRAYKPTTLIFINRTPKIWKLPLEGDLAAYADLIRRAQCVQSELSNFKPETLRAAYRDQPGEKSLPRYTRDLQPLYKPL